MIGDRTEAPGLMSEGELTIALMSSQFGQNAPLVHENPIELLLIGEDPVELRLVAFDSPLIRENLSLVRENQTLILYGCVPGHDGLHAGGCCHRSVQYAESDLHVEFAPPRSTLVRRQ
jgi:hypothetical protein